MANTADVRSEISVFLQRKISQRLRNTLFNIMPTLDFLFGLNGEKGSDNPSVGLGRPRTPILVSSIATAQAQREKMMAEREYRPIVQTTKPSTTEVKQMKQYDSDSTVPAWDTTNLTISRFTQPVVKFSYLQMPFKIAHDSLRTAKASSLEGGLAVKAITSIYDAEVKTRTAVLCEKLNNQLFGTSAGDGIPTDSTEVLWDSICSIQTALSDGTSGPGGMYCGIDRSLAQNSWARGNYITTATAPVFRNIIDYCNYTLGIANKGAGVQLIPVGATLFQIAKAEARAENYQVTNDGIRDVFEYGAKREVVRIFSGNKPVYIYYEPKMPAGSLAALDPSTWTVAIHPDRNFTINGPHDQRKIEGGDQADTGTIDLEIMVVCEVPSFNVWFSNVG